MFLAFASFSLCHHMCQADAIQSKIKAVPVQDPSGSRKLKSTEKENIRIVFVYDYIDGTKTDNNMCTYSGQTINFNGQEYNCTESDLVTVQQVNALIGTMENARTFLEETLKVIPLEQDITLLSDGYFFPPEIHGQSVSDCDFCMHIFLRAYGVSNTLASASYIQYLSTTYRPLQGGCWVNSRYCPTSTQNYDTANSSFFYTCVHEIFHALGITSQSFPYFHPQDSETPFENPTCTMLSYDIERTYLVTPYAHKFAQKHFGVDVFYGDNGATCPSGIELENGGGPGTALSHPDERVYMSDLMTGVSLQKNEGPFNRFTDVSIAMLLDTGNYEVDYTKGQPIIWGNGESIDGRVIDGFATMPPQNVFPSGYLGDLDFKEDVCGFDFKYIGFVSYSQSSVIESHQEFYNPKGLPEVGSQEIFEYMPIRTIYKSCIGPNKACIPGRLINESGAITCLDYVLDDNKLTYSYVDSSTTISIECTKANQEIIVNHDQLIGGGHFSTKIMCPNIERFRRTMNLYYKNFDSDPFEIKNVEEDPSSSTSTSPTYSSSSSTSTSSTYSSSSSTSTSSTYSPSTDNDDDNDDDPSSSVVDNTPNRTQIANATMINENDQQNFLNTNLTKYQFISVIIFGIAIIAFGIGLYIVCRKSKRKEKPIDENTISEYDSDYSV